MRAGGGDMVKHISHRVSVVRWLVFSERVLHLELGRIAEQSQRCGDTDKSAVW